MSVGMTLHIVWPFGKPLDAADVKGNQEITTSDYTEPSETIWSAAVQLLIPWRLSLA